ncbi:hypothetical protein PI125_g16943 [Phytophthora idaei]|nr:hypothetical protein PI125_g16943 [Phytophthora idaei]KAG3140711.1 hypothetical protein PI126_g15856 [Phytophthora idaei]
MNCTSIAETENGETGVLSLSTTFMRQLFSRFGEVILVDCTNKTSRYNYQLLAFITMNDFGEDGPAQWLSCSLCSNWSTRSSMERRPAQHGPNHAVMPNATKKQ